ncbi:MAG: hypothetical protein KGH78_00590 [Candidatus Micrarchaeota archaeon]|nr:hypothetical protein [Candidatus Micrarchaeota archaeon]MDE1846826.1 hypothetical protein [Candidatus Micrarchaeota archaeon]
MARKNPKNDLESEMPRSGEELGSKETDAAAKPEVDEETEESEIESNLDALTGSEGQLEKLESDLFPGTIGKERVELIDALVRVIKVANEREFVRKKPITYGGWNHYVFEGEYSEEVAGVPSDTRAYFWDNLRKLVELRDGTLDGEQIDGYYLSPEGRKLYKYVVNKYWEDLYPGTRSFLVTTGGMSMGEVLSVKSLITLGESELLESARNEVVKYFDASRNVTSLGNKIDELGRRSHSNSWRVEEYKRKIAEMQDHQKIASENITAALSVHLYNSGQLPLRLSRVGNDYLILDAIRVSSYSVANVTKYLEGAGLMNIMVDSSTIDELKDKIREEFQHIAILGEKSKEILRAKRELEYNYKEKREEIEKLGEERSKLLKEMGMLRMNAIRLFAVYVKKGGEVIRTDNVGEGRYTFGSFSFNKKEMDEKVAQIGLIDTCAVDIEKHYQSFRRGSLTTVAYRPIDIKGNLRLTIMSQFPGLRLQISEKSEACGANSIENPAYVARLISKASGMSIESAKAVELVKEMLKYGSLEAFSRAYSDRKPSAEEIAAWKIAHRELVEVSVTKAEMLGTLQKYVEELKAISGKDRVFCGTRAHADIQVKEHGDYLTLTVDLSSGTSLLKEDYDSLVNISAGNRLVEVTAPSGGIAMKVPRGDPEYMEMVKSAGAVFRTDKRLQTAPQIHSGYIEAKIADMFEGCDKQKLKQAVRDKLQELVSKKQIYESGFEGIYLNSPPPKSANRAR